MLFRSRKGCRVTFIPGNHDEALREYSGIAFGDIQLRNEAVHVTADGRRFLLIHGDEFDQVTRYHTWVAVIGDIAYNTLVWINTYLSRVRRRLGRPGYWSLAGYAKRKVKSAVSFIFDFEDSVIRALRERDVDGVVCGHIHAATIKEIDGLTYINCGDWVDSCTAIVEHPDGRMALIDWSLPGALPAPAVAAVPAQADERPLPHPMPRPAAIEREPI